MNEQTPQIPPQYQPPQAPQAQPQQAQPQAPQYEQPQYGQRQTLEPQAQPQAPQAPQAPQYYQQPQIQAPAIQGTNVMAVLSLVFAFVFSIVGIVLGHISLNQIKKTGEQGRGLALTGLVLSYVFTGIGLIFWVIYAVFIGIIISDVGF